MKRNGALAVLGIAVAGVALAAVGLIAYNMGVTNGGDGGHGAFGPMMRGYRGMEFGMGVGGWWGIIPALLVGLVIVLVVVALLAGAGRSAPSPAQAIERSPGGSARAGRDARSRRIDGGRVRGRQAKAARPLSDAAASCAASATHAVVDSSLPAQLPPPPRTCLLSW
jgi:hypothetical protein